MKPAPFEYHAPGTVADAVALLAEHGDDAKVLAGGQSLVPILAMRLSRFAHLVDVGRIDALRGIAPTTAGIRVGAMTTQSTVERDPLVGETCPLLAAATRFIGHVQIRNRGTLGGSLAHADPAAEYPAVALALDAQIELTGPAGARLVGAGEFFQSTWTTSAAADEVLTSVEFPAWRGSTGFAVEEVARRHGDFAMAGVVCGVEVADASVTRAAIAFFGTGSTATRARDAEAALLGVDTSINGAELAEVAEMAVADLDPPSDIHASGAHRRQMAKTVLQRAMRRAIEEATRV